MPQAALVAAGATQAGTGSVEGYPGMPELPVDNCDRAQFTHDTGTRHVLGSSQ